MFHDALIIGGSYAGMAAALQLARARRRVLVVDAGQRRNRYAAHSHGFLTRDGESPAAIADIARQQLLAYDTVTWIDGTAESAERVDGGFSVTIGKTGAARARRLILATGLRDHLPELPGLAERWGRSAFMCPYCDGYELDRGPVGVLATSALAMHQALLLPDWGPTTLLLNGAFVPDADQAAQLAARGVVIEPAPVLRLEGKADVVMGDGRTLSFAAVFVATRIELASPIGATLGCALDDWPQGQTLRTDALKATTVEGVYACGDAIRAAGSVSLAVADGAMAGMAVHRSLVFPAH
ncbi:thioredoxin reductase [Bordetella genomosp. 5]|uniref:NAD(P)/FAD-dependent oxidoreductase n=1 Tax=Bordetella genomosp. 5 TaxID=1395608 RepID=UPI000B9E3B4C|nr:NAD(P)/FAD-dependent oxidoreductase [Bordetella genomosp. 5]OZI42259.1 thioredoxin reductase [Bordetella genomosp. 5]